MEEARELVCQKLPASFLFWLPPDIQQIGIEKLAVQLVGLAEQLVMHLYTNESASRKDEQRFLFVKELEYSVFPFIQYIRAFVRKKTLPGSPTESHTTGTSAPHAEQRRHDKDPRYGHLVDFEDPFGA